MSCEEVPRGNRPNPRSETDRSLSTLLRRESRGGGDRPAPVAKKLRKARAVLRTCRHRGEWERVRTDATVRTRVVVVSLCLMLCGAACGDDGAEDAPDAGDALAGAGGTSGAGGGAGTGSAGRAGAGSGGGGAGGTAGSGGSAGMYS